ncbi:hypothetical protein BC2926_26010 [Bacillus cereus]|nr:hypothetical protein BC2926_26010 [Bacillus cereus]
MKSKKLLDSTIPIIIPIKIEIAPIIEFSKTMIINNCFFEAPNVFQIPISFFRSVRKWS